MKARIAFVILLIAICSHGLAAQATNYEKVIAGAERAFQKAAAAVSMPAPGCAVGVSLDGRPVFEKAFGLAEMEHNNPNTPQTIFELPGRKAVHGSGFGPAEQDGKLKLDDDVRKYIPELPEYSADHDRIC